MEVNSDVYSSELIKLVYECLDPVSDGKKQRRALCCDVSLTRRHAGSAKQSAVNSL